MFKKITVISFPVPQIECYAGNICLFFVCFYSDLLTVDDLDRISDSSSTHNSSSSNENAMRDIHQVAHNVNIICTSLCVMHSVIAFVEKLLCVWMQGSI